MYLIHDYSLKDQQESKYYDFNNTYFSFKDNNPNNVIDGDIFYPLADALHRHKKCDSHFTNQANLKKSLVPYLYIYLLWGKQKYTM